MYKMRLPLPFVQNIHRTMRAGWFSSSSSSSSSSSFCVSFKSQAVTVWMLSMLIAMADGRAFIAQIASKTGPTSSPYYVVYNFSIGTPPQAQQLLLSIDSATYPWLKCGSSGSAFVPSSSSSFHYVQCARRRPPKPCTVRLPPYSLTGRLASDDFYLHVTNGSYQGPFSSIPHIKLACVSGSPTIPISGVFPLSPSKRSIPAQFSSKGILLKFAYCLPSPGGGPGPIFIGGNIDYFFGNPPIMNISAFLAPAKLLETRRGQFALGVRGIKVDGKSISQNVSFDLILSSEVRYTKLERSIYAALRTSFKQAATTRGIASVAGTAGFDTCFNASTIGFSRVGLAVPPIELDLQGIPSGLQPWQVFGFNSMVSVSQEIVCLGFVDAGAKRASVLGTFQQQNNLLEFDMAKERLGFSGVLDFYRTTCSDFSF